MRAAAIARRHAFHAAVCDVVEPWAHGTLVRATAFPHWWDVNSVRVHAGAPAPSADELAAEADRWLARLEHRKVEIEDEATGVPLAEALRARGWQAERLVSMRRDDAAPPPPAGLATTEFTAAQLDNLRVEWLLDEQVMHDEPSIRAYLAEEATAQRRLPGALIFLGVPGVAFVSARLDGTQGEIEDAFVSPGARGTGLGTGLLHAAIARASAAGVRDLWILADADGRPRELYERLGFRAAWTYWDCVRRPPAKSDAPRR